VGELNPNSVKNFAHCSTKQKHMRENTPTPKKLLQFYQQQSRKPININMEVDVNVAI
jgi:hypothetical protein